MGIFDNLDQANVFESSKYFQPGRYIVEIAACKFNSGGYKGDSFVVESKVLATTSEHPEAPAPGETAAHVWNASGEKRDIARSTWLGFLCAVYGVGKDDYTGPDWRKISEKVIGENALAGTLIEIEVFMKKTRAGNDFTQHKYIGVPSAETLAEFGLDAA